MDRQLFFQSQTWLRPAPLGTLGQSDMRAVMRGTSSSSCPMLGGADSTTLSMIQPRKRARTDGSMEQSHGNITPPCSCAWVTLHAACHVNMAEQASARSGHMHNGRMYHGVLARDALHIAFATHPNALHDTAHSQHHAPAQQDPMQCNVVLRLGPQPLLKSSRRPTSPSPRVVDAEGGEGTAGARTACGVTTHKTCVQPPYQGPGNAHHTTLDHEGPQGCAQHSSTQETGAQTVQQEVDVLLDGVAYLLQSDQVLRVVMSEAVATEVAQQLTAGCAAAAGDSQRDGFRALAVHPLVTVVAAAEQGPKPPFITLVMPHVCFTLYKRMPLESGEQGAAEALSDLARSTTFLLASTSPRGHPWPPPPAQAGKLAARATAMPPITPITPSAVPPQSFLAPMLGPAAESGQPHLGQPGSGQQAARAQANTRASTATGCAPRPTGNELHGLLHTYHAWSESCRSWAMSCSTAGDLAAGGPPRDPSAPLAASLGYLGIHLHGARAAHQHSCVSAQAQLPEFRAQVTAVVQQLCAQPGPPAVRDLDRLHALLVQVGKISEVDPA